MPTCSYGMRMHKHIQRIKLLWEIHINFFVIGIKLVFSFLLSPPFFFLSLSCLLLPSPPVHSQLELDGGTFKDCT